MNDGIGVDVRGLFLDPATQTAIVMLSEAAGATRVVPIVIGAAEAESIAIGLSGVDLPRPMTHDLLLRIMGAASCAVLGVDVVRLEGGTFFAELEIDLGGYVTRIDARPSDCLALAVRTGVPISVDRDVFERVSVGVQALSGDGFDEEEIDRIMAEFRSFLDDADPSDFMSADEPDEGPEGATGSPG